MNTLQPSYAPIPWEHIESLLHRVIKPGRYVGGEYNTVHKPWDSVDMHVCLAFPDVYDLGMSNFALTILYDILNAQSNTLAERAYLPAPDMIDQMRAANMPLYTLESYRPLAAFDILAISTAYEQLFTNVLELLDLAGLPIHSAERTNNHPLIISGGHGTFNAEPITDFFDAFVIGEGEAVILEIVETLRQTRSHPREEQLRALVKIPGVYVPRFYRVNYTQAGTIAAVSPTIPEAPATIKKRLMPDLPPTPIHQIVPNIEIVHDRATIEIHRGCTRGCRFCQAGTITRPVRERPAAEIEESIAAVIEATGYEEVAPLSLSSADHSEIQEILTRLLKRFEGQHISISLPSLRIESVSVDLADMLTQGRRSGFTIAPEAATDKLRNRINKSIATEQILQVAEEIFTRGWRTLKLYFMLGLPGETDEDIEAIADIAHRVKHIAREKQGRKAEVHISMSTFVPKPHTVFQWEPLAGEETIEQRQGYLKRRVRGRGMRLMWNSYSDTLLEALLARGDRRLNAVIERAWQLGARFDAWQDWHNDAAWQQAFTENDVDLDFYLYRQRSEDEVFPWDHIHSGVEKSFLLQDYQRSLEGELLSDCRERCHACGILTNYPSMHTEEWQCLKKH